MLERELKMFTGCLSLLAMKLDAPRSLAAARLAIRYIRITPMVTSI
jgi:hypothetical protein